MQGKAYDYIEFLGRLREGIENQFLKKTTHLTTGWDAPNLPIFWRGFSELHLASDESLGRTRKNDPVVLELASDFRASG